MSQRNPARLIRHYAYSTDPDRLTSMSDARIFLCLAQGVAMDDIDPASGYDYSPNAYDRCRQSWVSNIKYHGFSAFYDGEALGRALSNWTAHRPDLIADDDWLADAENAHREYWGQPGHSCNRPTCDVHADDDNAPVIPRIPGPRRSPEQPTPPIPPQRDRRAGSQD